MATISDRILNAVTGRKMETIKIPYEQLLSMVDDLFISEAETEEELNQIEEVCSKSAINVLLSTKRNYISKNGRYEITFNAGAAGESNSFWVHDLDADKFFQLDKSKNMKKLTKAIKVKIAQTKIYISTGKRNQTTVTASEPIQTIPPAMGDLNQLAQLKELLDSGVINQEEFDIKKKQILNLDGSIQQVSTASESNISPAEITSDKISHIKSMCINFVESYNDLGFSTSESLANALSIPIDSEIYFMYDITFPGKEKNGFALTSTGIYYKSYSNKNIFASYEEIRDCHNIYVRKADIYAGSKEILTMPAGKKYKEALVNLIVEIKESLQ